MDKVLKRRLIGASILIALAVIFVPMLLVDPDAVEDGSGSGVDVPAMPDSAREVRRIPLDPEAARVARSDQRSGGDAEPDAVDGGRDDGREDGREDGRGDGRDNRLAEEAERVPPDDEIVLRPDLAERQQESSPEDPAVATEPPDGQSGPGDSRLRQEETDSARPPESEGESDVEPEPEPEPETGSEPGEEPDGGAAEPAPEVSLGDWVVQVASFGSRDSAERVRERLEALGHIVTRDEIVRGQTLLYRLRTGPYPSRDAARNALEQIVATVAGVEPIVREVDERLRDGMEPGFAVQVGSFVSEDNAESETLRLEGLDFEAFRFSEQVGERVIWRVMVGPVAERDAAEQLKSRLADQAGVEGLVVSYP